MPTYVYQCEIHGEFEEFHSIKEQLEDCPLCQKEGKAPHKVKRVISGAGGFILKGSGWAKDNYG